MRYAVFLRHDGTAPELRALVEAALSETFDYPARVDVLDDTRLGALLAACPFPADDLASHTHVTVTSDPAVLDALDEAVSEADPDAPAVRLGPEATAWTVAVGGTLGARRSTISSRVRYAPSITDRNLRTMLAVHAALTAMGPDEVG